ncbi:ROK family protein [Rothia sp. ZJ1223]|uniref:ROK family protein n=1 Tax=Rothia sp. ZJ1223 TaxID=2811098 RepID=UPI00195C7DB4|nr:ROK family protein [Rothia sp. ZJ1223]MBM7052067.1 ROK family protein [Rothia sp. ZJ1223]
MTQQFAVGIDLGGTKTAFGVVDANGQVYERHEIPTIADIGGEELARNTARGALTVIEQVTARGGEVTGIGIGSAGVIGAEGEVITAANVITDWSGVPLAHIISEETGLPTYAVNDVHAHALGESWAGAAAEAPSSLLVAFGTGVGGGYISQGEPLKGAHFLAGHVGHFSSPLALDIPCPCGGTGHLEAVAAGPAIHRRYLATGGDASSPDTKDVAARARAGEQKAIDAIEFAARAAGIALGDLVNILNPHVLVLSGGMVNLGDLWLPIVEKEFRAAALGQAKETPLVAAQLGSDAPIIGAATLIPNFLER